MKRCGRPEAIVTDQLRSYRAALRELGGSGLQQAGHWLNNRHVNFWFSTSIQVIPNPKPITSPCSA